MQRNVRDPQSSTCAQVPLIPGSDLLRIQINLEYNWRTQAREVWWK